MSSLKQQARYAGFLYLLVAIIAPFAVFYIPGKLVVRGDAVETATRVAASESLFRVGIYGHLLSTMLFLFTVLALYRLLKAVNQAQALTMLVLVAVGSAVAFTVEVNRLAAVMIFGGTDFLAVFDKRQLDAMGYMFLRLGSLGGSVAQIFWGLWLFPFGLLVVRSGFIPRAFGFLLMIAGSAYLVSASTGLLAPQHSALVGRFAMPLYFGEVPIIFWLLIWGAREPRVAAAVPQPASG